MGPSAAPVATGRRWLRVPLHIALALVVLWEVLAIGYTPALGAAWLRWSLAGLFAFFSIWGLWLSRTRGPRYVVLGLFIVSWAVWAAIRPSHDRPWRPEVAVMPRIHFVDGDRVRIEGYRHFDYRTRDDFTVRHEVREVRLSALRALDFYVSYWSVGPVGHTFLSFVFDDADPVSISIETRPEIGEGFDPVASLFKHFELIYVVGDERDIVRVRTNYRDEQVFLYRTTATPEQARALFRIYAERVNELAERPEFYHLLSNSCTINIVRYANRVGRMGRLDFRHVLNGWSDRYLYGAGRVDTSLPFEELRQRANIVAAAQAADQAPDFWRRIRVGLPVPDAGSAAP